MNALYLFNFLFYTDYQYSSYDTTGQQGYDTQSYAAQSTTQYTDPSVAPQYDYSGSYTQQDQYTQGTTLPMQYR